MSDDDFAAVRDWDDFARLLVLCKRPPSFLKEATYRVRGRVVRYPISLRRYASEIRAWLVKPFAMVMTLGGATLRPSSLSTWTYDVWGAWDRVRMAARICHTIPVLLAHASDMVMAEIQEHQRIARIRFVHSSSSVK